MSMNTGARTESCADWWIGQAEWVNHGGMDIKTAVDPKVTRIVHGNTMTAAAVCGNVMQVGGISMYTGTLRPLATREAPIAFHLIPVFYPRSWRASSCSVVSSSRGPHLRLSTQPRTEDRTYQLWLQQIRTERTYTLYQTALERIIEY